MKKTDPTYRCLALLKDLRKKLEQTGQWEDVGDEIDAIICDIEEEVLSISAGKKRSKRLENLLLKAALVIRLILQIS